MSKEERKFLEIADLRKGFGSGDTRQEVLRGMSFSVAKGEFCVFLGLPVPENLRFLILLAELTVLIRVIYRLMAISWKIWMKNG